MTPSHPHLPLVKLVWDTLWEAWTIFRVCQFILLRAALAQQMKTHFKTTNSSRLYDAWESFIEEYHMSQCFKVAECCYTMFQKTNWLYLVAFKVLGRGTFGKVVLCREKKNQVQTYLLFSCQDPTPQKLYLDAFALLPHWSCGFSEALCDEDLAEGGDRQSGRGEDRDKTKQLSWKQHLFAFSCLTISGKDTPQSPSSPSSWRWSTPWRRRGCWRAAPTPSSSVWGLFSFCSPLFHHQFEVKND